MFSRRLRLYLLLSALAGACLLATAPDWSEAGNQGIQPAGVEVSPEGVFRTKIFRDPGGRLAFKRRAAAMEKLPADLTRTSKLRKISLNRLEAALAERLKRGEFETDEMKYLAGLTRITHVFCYPETNDIVIAGPAEGFVTTLADRPIGIDSGKAILELQDLVTALRAYPPTGDRTSNISVSIDPTKEGLQRMQNFLARLGGQAFPRDTRRIVQGLRENLGMQTVSIRGVSPKTHFAQVLVEADYRMKLIGIGLERPAVDLTTYVERANPRDVSRNALQRWYFVPNYDCVHVTDDKLGMQMVGSTIKLIGADEMVTADGERVAAGVKDPAGKAYTTSFTKNYDKMASETPVYGQLRNLVDMAVTAAFIQRMDYYNKTEWGMEVFGDEGQFQVETYTAPKQVETAVNAKWKGRTLMTPVGGGVEINPLRAIRSDVMKRDSGSISDTRQQVDTGKLSEIQWWWD